MEAARRFVDRYYDLIATGDVQRLAMLYADGAEIIRYDGVASHTRRDRRLLPLDDGTPPRREAAPGRPAAAGQDVLMWDALLDSDEGVLQTVDVMVLDDDGRITRHIPGFRGYWGR